MYTQYECVVTTHDYYLDVDNHRLHSFRSHTVDASSLCKLYSILAKELMRETPEDERDEWECYTGIEFGDIRCITVQSVIPVDASVLTQTPEWQEYTRKRQEEEKQEADERQRQRMAEEAAERALFERLREKYSV
jgi:hypothetical protein